MQVKPVWPSQWPQNMKRFPAIGKKMVFRDVSIVQYSVILNENEQILPSFHLQIQVIFGQILIAVFWETIFRY